MKTQNEKIIDQQLNITEFPFEIKDNNGYTIYSENSGGYCSKKEYDQYGNIIQFEYSTDYWMKRHYVIYI